MKINIKIFKNYGLILVVFSCLTIFSSCDLNPSEQSIKTRASQNDIHSFFDQPSDTRFRTIEDDELTINEIRLMLSRDEQIYRNIRVHNDTKGTMTYQIPIPCEELDYLLNRQYSSKTTSTNQFPCYESNYLIDQQYSSQTTNTNQLLYTRMA